MKDLYVAMIERNGVVPDVEEAGWYGIIENALGYFRLLPPKTQEDNGLKSRYVHI